jgi:lipoprotein-anchoring transpeptidase ErfK/SrfK
MVFRTVGAIAALLIGVAWQDGQARAQYYSPQSSAQPMVGQQYGLRPLMPIEAEPNVTGTLGSNPRSHMVALQPNPRPGAGPAKELPPRFRRTLVNYQTKEPSGTIIIDTANTYLYLVLGNGKALRYGIGVGAPSRWRLDPRGAATRRLADNTNRRSKVLACRSDWWQRPVAWKT